MTRRQLPVLIAGALYTLGMAATAIVAAWPVYASGQYIVLAASAVAAAVLLAAASRQWAWPGWAVAVAGLGLFVVLGVVISLVTVFIAHLSWRGESHARQNPASNSAAIRPPQPTHVWPTS